MQHLMFHDGEVNRARYMPSNPHVIASKTITGEVQIFDKSKHPSNIEYIEKAPFERVAAKPQMRLTGHTKEGYGLDWNPFPEKRGYIASCGEDGLVCVWNIAGGITSMPSYSMPAVQIDPTQKFSGHGVTVNDVLFHPVHQELLGSIDDAGKLMIWDMRAPGRSAAQVLNVTRKSGVPGTSLSFNPFREYLFATGDAEGNVGLWDLRHAGTHGALHNSHVHRDDVLSLQFSPHSESILASSSADRRVMVWDMSRIGQEQTEEDAADGPPELLFIHAGHTARVNEISWNPNKGCEWILASTAEDNVVMVWQMAENIYMRDDAFPPLHESHST
jgi:histone-binding protein RBBP4